MAHQPLDFSLTPDARDNMSIFHPFVPSGDTWNSQVTDQQHHTSPLGQTTSPWHGFHLNSPSDAYSTNISGARRMQHTPPGDDDSPGSIEQCSRHGGPSPYRSSRSSYSQLSTTSLSSIDPKLTEKNSSLHYPHAVSPDRLTTAAPSPTSPHYQNTSPAQAAGHTIGSAGSYFFPKPQSSARRRRQPASSLQGWEHYPNQNVGDFDLSPRSPYQPVHYDESKDIEASPSPHECYCGANFGRLTDLERHQTTSKKHNKEPAGPACPFNLCSYTSSFTRVDNFKAHCVNQHKVSGDEVNVFIKEWRDRGKPKGLWWLSDRNV